MTNARSQYSATNPSATLSADIPEDNTMTWTQSDSKPKASGDSQKKIDDVQNISQMFDIRPEQPNLRRMHNAVKLNEVIVTESHDAQLVILNLPGPPKKDLNDADAPNK